MTRKTKQGIDYFSHDVDILQDKKIKLIKAKHGLIGYAVYLRLLEEIYRETGYYLKVDEDFNILFSDDNNIDFDAYILILNDCIDKNLFDKQLYEKYKILTSERIQRNYCSATERRKEAFFIKEYLLIDIKEMYKTSKINVNILDLNVDIKEENVNKSTQSKVKKKESKVNTYSNEFESCFKIYPTRDGVRQGKKSASELFEKLSLEEKRKLFIGIKNYNMFLELPTTTQKAMDMERFIRKQFYNDYQEKIEYSEPVNSKQNGYGSVNVDDILHGVI